MWRAVTPYEPPSSWATPPRCALAAGETHRVVVLCRPIGASVAIVIGLVQHTYANAAAAAIVLLFCRSVC
jgi:hypothetical protein